MCQTFTGAELLLCKLFPPPACSLKCFLPGPENLVKKNRLIKLCVTYSELIS